MSQKEARLKIPGDLDIEIPSVLGNLHDRRKLIGGRIGESCIKEVEDGSLDREILGDILEGEGEVRYKVGTNSSVQWNQLPTPDVLLFNPHGYSLN